MTGTDSVVNPEAVALLSPLTAVPVLDSGIEADVRPQLTPSFTQHTEVAAGALLWLYLSVAAKYNAEMRLAKELAKKGGTIHAYEWSGPQWPTKTE